MSTYVAPEIFEEIQKLTESWKYDEALRVVNEILSHDPKNEDALLLVADILYRQWDIQWADKAINFLNALKKNDPLALYIKWLLEMEKNNRKEARAYMKKAMWLTNEDNHEIIRCYWLCEYWYWNREKWRNYLDKAFQKNSLDAEVIYNIIQLSILEEDFKEAEKKVKYYYENHENLKTVDKTISRYDSKIQMFDKLIVSKNKF